MAIGDTFSQPDVLHAFYLTFLITVITVVVTTRLRRRSSRWCSPVTASAGSAFVRALVDLPLAVSPVIVGLMAVLLFGTGGWFEPWFAARGIQIIFAVPSMMLVTIFICIPFVIREVVPVLPRARHGGGGGRADARRLLVPDVPAGDLAEHPLGAACTGSRSPRLAPSARSARCSS